MWDPKLLTDMAAWLALAVALCALVAGWRLHGATRARLSRAGERIAALKRENARMKEAQRVAGLESWSRNPKSGEWLWSEGICRLLGADPGDTEMNLGAFLGYVHAADRDCARQVLTGPSAGAEPRQCVVRVLSKDGSTRHIGIRTRAGDDAGGGPWHVAGTVTDLGGLWPQHEDLVRQERKRAQAEVISGLNHNLNNLLNGLAAPSQFLRSSAQSEETRRWAEIVHSSAQRAADLMKRLNDAVAGSREPVQAVDVNAQVQSCAKLVYQQRLSEHRKGSGRVGVSVDLQPLPPAAAAPSELQGVLRGLLLNAMEAMPGGGVIRLRTRHVDGRVMIRVADSGEGMDEDTKKHLFEPLFTTKVDIGAGLDLYKTHEMVTAWGGEIQVESAPGAGSKFTLWLPEWTPGMQSERHRMTG